MPKNNLTFDQALKRFKNAQTNVKKLAHLCACMAIQHFKDHGNLTPAQQFLDAMEHNFMRRQAFVDWLIAYSPTLVEKGKLYKDKHEGSEKRFNLEAALAVPFWDFSPAKPLENYTEEDIEKSFLAVIKRFENEERKKPADDVAKRRFEILRTAVKNAIAVQIPHDTMTNKTDDEAAVPVEDEQRAAA